MVSVAAAPAGASVDLAEAALAAAAPGEVGSLEPDAWVNLRFADFSGV
jgi:hypothetical protein